MPNPHLQNIQAKLHFLSSEAKAASARRYFPAGVNCLGVTAKDITQVIADFKREQPSLTPDEMLALTEEFLKQATYSEEVLVAFALIQPLVKKHYDEDLLLRFHYWLEHYASNWSHVDDLCIKTAYNFLLSRPHLIRKTQYWSDSSSPWCRRASNVVWVKFINRKIGKTVYQLDIGLVFENTDKLLADPDPFVQKSIGWLLKATSVQHPQAVLDYLSINHQAMPRSTLRYALEKVNTEQRKQFLAMANR
ncbi:MAG: DNA alkylation repair protein [Oceanospirillaceae bacterium]|nr:DNA alkylation repair protein [Oceanospirillaceae bacterium]